MGNEGGVVVAETERRRQPFRSSDKWQMWISCCGLMYLVTVVAFAQSQDAINATVFERMANIALRLDKIENYITAMIVALVSNLIAHIVSIKTQRNRRG